MPTYDYICDACGHEFEAFESIKADPQKDCPACKTPKLRRKIGAGAAILFKGSGFYQTDYRSESYKKAAKAEKSSSEPASTSKSEGSKSEGSKSEGSKTDTGKTSSGSSSSSPNGAV
jgi:putative FmdB family regulatory protein